MAFTHLGKCLVALPHQVLPDFSFASAEVHFSHSGENGHIGNHFLYRRQFYRTVKGRVKLNLRCVFQITAILNC